MSTNAAQPARCILHADMNACYASIEQAENPRLRHLPVIVGGDEEARHGIVLAASREAKASGVRTAMTLWQARKACPQAIVVPARLGLYHAYGERCRRIYYDYSSQVEPFGIDECWLDVSASTRLWSHEPLLIAQEISERVKSELGVTVSVGVGWDKITAKFGSDHAGHDRIMTLTPSTLERRMWPSPARELLYVGPATERKLRRIGIRSIGQLACAPADELVRLLGKMGAVLRSFARGEDLSPVRNLALDFCDVERAVKSVGNAMTLPFDVADGETARQVVWLLGESVCQRLRALGLAARTVGVSARGADFDLPMGGQRQRTLPQATDSTQELCHAAAQLMLDWWDFGRMPARQIGVRVAGLEVAQHGPVQLDVFGEEQRRLQWQSVDRTSDRLRGRFGNHAVRRAGELRDPRLAGLDPERDNVTHPYSYFA